MSKIFNSLVALPLVIGTLWGGERVYRHITEVKTSREPIIQVEAQAPSVDNLQSSVKAIRNPNNNVSALSVEQQEQTQSQESMSKRQFLEGQLAKYGKDTNGTTDGNKTFVIENKYLLYVNKNNKIIISENGIKLNLSRPESGITMELQSAINNIDRACLQQNSSYYPGSCFD